MLFFFGILIFSSVKNNAKPIFKTMDSSGTKKKPGILSGGV